MHEIEIIFGLVLVVAVLAVAAEKLVIPYPILLVLCGLVLSFIPGLPHVELNPEFVFVLFLPPLLTSAAWNTSWRDFRVNLRPILLLAIGLVLVTTTAIAIFAHQVIGLPWAAAFVLGAIVSPPDAVAATAITQRLSVPRCIVTVLEGESLVNDATGLVAYRFAVAAVMTGAFSIWQAGVQFFVMAIGGILVGLALGWVVVRIHQLVDDSLVEISTTLLMSFGSYIIAEHLGVSGVLAAVSIGLYHRWHSPEVLSPRTRIQSVAVWELVTFLLNGLIFILIGLQLPQIIAGISDYALVTLISYAGLSSIVVIVVRLLWVFAATYLPRLVYPSSLKRDPAPPWQHMLLIGWTGMRGVVSLAAALALPRTLASGVPFPQRDLILFLTFCVILVTLVLQGLTLPVLIRWLKVTDDGTVEREEMEARLRAAEAGIERLEEIVAEDQRLTEAVMVKWLRSKYKERIRRLSECCDALDQGDQAQLDAIRKLQREVLLAERRRVTRLRNQGIIGDDAMQHIERELDLEATRLGA